MHPYVEYLQIILLMGLLSFILLWIAKASGYFQLPYSKEERTNLMDGKTIIVIFVIYLGMTTFIGPILAKTIRFFFSDASSILILGLLQLFLLLAIFALFYLYCNAQSPEMFKKIWKDRSVPNSKPILTDLFMGVLSWIISFPLVIAIGQLADMILHFLFGFENYEQVAVLYLKGTLGSPFMLTVALLTIMIAAPVIEEFIFRGCLQTYFKRHMRPKNAIILSALCFAFFHFASSQGVGNLSLLSSLFVFALFLGFIYQRQASLYASIGLHMTFNAVSTIRILFFPE